MIARFLRQPLNLRPALSSCFNTTGLQDELLVAVDQLNINSSNGASSEQKKAIRASLDGQHVGLFTGTGSGKTLAYLLPLAARLKADEVFQLSIQQHNPSFASDLAPSSLEAESIDGVDGGVDGGDGGDGGDSGTNNSTTNDTLAYRPEPRRPRAVVLAPSRELCVQISSVAKKLAHNCKLKVIALDGSGSMKRQRESLESGADIVVATPGRLQKHREKGHLFLSRVMCLVLDEADALVSTDFGLDAAEIVEALTSRDNSKKRSKRRGPYPEKCLFTVVSATGKSHRLEKLMKKHMPGIVQVHEDVQKRRAQRNEIFIQSPAREKYLTLASVLKSMKSPTTTSSTTTTTTTRRRRVEPTLVFCNSVASCRSAEHLLREQGYGSIGYHSDMPSNVRNDNFDTFKKNNVEIMVCTDIAARGLDLRHVKHVVNLDFPRTKEWYIHRAGRTARAGDTGRVTSIYTKHEKDIAGEIMQEVKDMRRAVNSENQNEDGSQRPRQSKTKRKGQIQTKGAFGKRVQGNAPRRSSSKQQSGTSSTLYSNLDRVKRANERRG